MRAATAVFGGVADPLKTLAIVVNYKSARLTLEAVRSILASDSIGPVRIVVVDNSEDRSEAETLRLHLSPKVSLWISPRNIGFGHACNLALEQFEGEYVLLLNPDAKLMPGCLLRLQKTLSSRNGVGAVSPQIFWDDRLQFYLPPPIPFFIFEFQTMFDKGIIRYPIRDSVSRAWRCRSLKVWRSKRPVRVKNLSGGLMLLKMEAIKRIGRLFDPRFFLYFEDADLCIRLRKAGYTLVIEPRAKGVHYYDATGRNELDKKRMLMDQSRALFIEKYDNRFMAQLKSVAGRLMLFPETNRMSLPEASITSPFEMKVPESFWEAWLFEWSPNPDLIPSAGKFGQGSVLRFQQSCWDRLTPGRYFGRLGRPKRLEGNFVRFSWQVENSTPIE